MTLIAQYYGKSVLEWEDANSQNPLTAQAETLNRLMFGQTHQVQHGGILTLRFNLLNQTMHIDAMGDFNFVTQDLRTVLKIGYDITDAFNITAGFSLVYGPDGSRMNEFKDMYRNIFLETSISF